MQEENKLVSAYQKLYGSALIEFDGQKLPLPMMAKYCESPDREVREKAYKANSKFFEEHSAELDELYDKLVKNRNARRKSSDIKLYRLGYDRSEKCYGQERSGLS